jgi:hypothetical protein
LAEQVLRSVETIGLRPAFRSPIAWLDDQRVCLRWAWPASRFSEQCVLTVTAREPAADDDPEAINSIHRVRLDRRAWNASCGCHVLTVQDNYQGAWAAAWAVLPLDEHDSHGPPLFSHPLLLGRIERTK